jgi:DNA-binding response OmpR family regulator
MKPGGHILIINDEASLRQMMAPVLQRATDYLLKPLKPQTVIDRTQAILASKQEARHKRELQRKIETLQAELSSLQSPKGKSAGSKDQQSLAADDRFLKRGLLTLDLLARRVTMNERAVSLPTASFDYLVVLARHAPQVVDYQTLVSEAQGYETDTREAQELSRWHIHHIRQVIEPDMRNPIYVINVRGTGYRLAMN